MRVSAKYLQIYRVVQLIPEGKVATYGQVARLAGFPGQARQVGYALAALHGELPVPWHRVVNAQGRISCRSEDGVPDPLQRVRLEHEGVRFDRLGRISLERYQWQAEWLGEEDGAGEE
ncbi:methyltransferase [Geomonas silvestris]|uniref:Methyltransferase n=1 Tax=Geomonas silvestris TaxID=2740184 RepID=A0A6V8MH10_9BACT|nr:MGMT family protein [Geomonas silvestris]GFO59270.1 methyltransferase [Geomonas silvestris]